jgi:hypothetical protein
MVRRFHASFAVVFVLSFSAIALAAEPGFVQDFNSGDTGGFSSFATLDPIASGGVGGDGDGYLRTTRMFVGRLGAHSTSAPLSGDLAADGVTGYSFWLNDVGADDNIEVHFGIGRSFSNFWVTEQGFVPPNGQWAEFSVDVTSSDGWIQIQGAGSFEDALAISDRILFRHDTSPISMEPTQLVGDFGIDRITVLPAGDPNPPPAVPESTMVSFLATTMFVIAVGTWAIRRRTSVVV